MARAKSINPRAVAARRREESIAKSLGATRARLVVLMKVANGKLPGGAAALAAFRHGLVDHDAAGMVRLTDTGTALLAKARAKGF
jgi:hypothetical protein